MKRSRSYWGRSLRRVSVLAAASLLGCGSDLEPCRGVVQGAELEITILGPAPDSSITDNCHELWGLAPQTSNATIVRLSGDEDCKAGVPDVDGLGDWQVELEQGASSPGGGVILDGLYRLQKDSCAAHLSLSLSSEGIPCDAAQSSCRLIFTVNPDMGEAADCPPSCGGALDARVTQL